MRPCRTPMWQMAAPLHQASFITPFLNSIPCLREATWCGKAEAHGPRAVLRGVKGTIRVCYFCGIIGIVSVNLAEVLVTGCSAVLVQYLWQSAQKLRLVQMLFNVASAAIAITASYAVFHSAWLRSLPLEWSVMLALLACTYFACTTILVAAVISLTEGKSFGKVWRTSYLWAFPYYMLGAATAGVVVVGQPQLG